MESVIIVCLVQPVSVSRTHARLATLASDVTFAYNDVTEDDDLDAMRLQTASDKTRVIFFGIASFYSVSVFS